MQAQAAAPVAVVPQPATDAPLAPRMTALPLVPTNMQEAWRLSEALAQSSLVPDHFQGKPHNVLAAVLMGQDLGISTMQAMREIHVVKGKPSASAALKVALVRQSHLCLKWEYDEGKSVKGQSATFVTRRRGDAKDTSLTFTLDDAKRAGLYPGKDDSAWNRWTDNMLRARCESFLTDLVYPDVVKGLSTKEEMEEVLEREVNGSRIFEHTQAPPAPVAQETAPQQAAPAPEAPKAESAPQPPVDPSAPDAIDVLLNELELAERPADVDAISRRANDVIPKGHQRRKEVGDALNKARARVKS